MLGSFPYPDVRGPSKEADAESARMPRKRKAGDDGFQDPHAKKSKPAEESNQELFPLDGRTSDGRVR
jgi:hypothetical protein